MKKNIFASTSALLAVAGFSSFKNTKAFTISYYWFAIPSDTNIALIDLHPTFYDIGGEAAYVGHAQAVTDLDGYPSCDGGSFYCVVGYTLNSIHGFDGLGTPTALKTVGLGSGIPKSVSTNGGVNRD